MAERPSLTYEEFLVLAALLGLEADEDHLSALYDEVAPMYERIELIRSVAPPPDAPLSAPEAVSEA